MRNRLRDNAGWLLLAALVVAAITLPSVTHAQTPVEQRIDLLLLQGGFTDPNPVVVFGVETEVIFLDVGGDWRLLVSPCPTTWEIRDVRIDGVDLDASGRPECADATDTAQWTGDGSGLTPPLSGEILRFTAVHLFNFVESTTAPRNSGGLRGLACDSGPASEMNPMGCISLMLFIPPVILVGTLAATGITNNPMVLGGAGGIAMTAMAALLIPGPIFIVGFACAAFGLGALMLMLRR